MCSRNREEGEQSNSVERVTMNYRLFDPSPGVGTLIGRLDGSSGAPDVAAS